MSHVAEARKKPKLLDLNIILEEQFLILTLRLIMTPRIRGLEGELTCIVTE
jgi:hypothetical protein